ncbi:MAG: hypothetical protein KIT83_20170 [Bryobacterales bacterium]|nr:hypothetical protein [Bryobacterales bacterium]
MSEIHFIVRDRKGPRKHVSGKHLRAFPDAALPPSEVSAGLGLCESWDLGRLREATRTGRPLGTPNFAAELVAQMDRRLFPQEA